MYPRVWQKPVVPPVPAPPPGPDPCGLCVPGKFSELCWLIVRKTADVAAAGVAARPRRPAPAQTCTVTAARPTSPPVPGSAVTLTTTSRLPAPGSAGK